jgi:hypothetical protein
MAFQLLLDEVEHLHGVSTRLEKLAEDHAPVTAELLSIAGHVHGAATLLAVLVATKLHNADGHHPHE